MCGCSHLLWRQSAPARNTILGSNGVLPREGMISPDLNVCLAAPAQHFRLNVYARAPEALVSVTCTRSHPLIAFYNCDVVDQGNRQKVPTFCGANERDLRVDDDSPMRSSSFSFLSRANPTSTVARCPWRKPHTTARVPIACTVGTATNQQAGDFAWARPLRVFLGQKLPVTATTTIFHKNHAHLQVHSFRERWLSRTRRRTTTLVDYFVCRQIP